jgi:uncharacterized damage-inducible protein DinB
MSIPTTTAPHSAAELVPVSALFSDLDAEFAATRKLLERFPDEHADWRPHERSATLAALAAHIAELPGFGEAIAGAPEFDFATTPYTPASARTKAELLALFDDSVVSMRKALSTLDAPALLADWTLRSGDTVFVSGPRAESFRRLFVSHSAHHRGQLTVYYRLLGVPVAGPYGPSADEM